MRKLIFTLLSFLISSSVQSQSIGYNWIRSQNGAAGDLTNDIVVSNDNFVYACGNFSSASLTVGTTTLTNSGLSDIFLAKYDTSGNLIWAKKYGGSTNDNAKTITADSLNNIYIAGMCAGAANFGSLSFPGGNYILKINAAGTETWVTPAASNVNITDLSSDPSGNTVICGYFTGGASIGGTAVTAHGGNDGFVAKFDISGTFSWLKLFYNTAAENCSAVTVAASGAISVGGDYRSNDKLYLGNAVSATDSMTSTWVNNAQHPGIGDAAFICTLQSNGNLSWIKDNLAVNDGAHYTIVSAVTAASNGDLYFGITAVSRGLTSSIHNSSVRKYSNAGSLIWTKPVGVIFLSYFATGILNPIIALNNNRIYASDRCMFLDAELTYAIRAYNTAGDTLWSSLRTGSSINALGASNTAAFAAGTLTSGSLANLSSSFSGGGSDGFVAKILGPQPLPPLALSAPLPDRSICVGGSVTLAQSSSVTGGTPPYTYQWTPSAGLSNANIFNPSASPASTTVYILNITDAAAQTVYDTLIVNVLPQLAKPSLAVNPGALMDTLICSSPYSGLTYQWNTGESGTSSRLVIGQNSFIYAVRIDQPAVPGCYVSSDLFYYKTLKANAGRDTTITAGESVVLGGTPAHFGSSPGTVNYYWMPLTGLNNGMGAHPVATPSVTTDYIMILSDGTGYHKIDDTVKVTVVPVGPGQGFICPGSSTSYSVADQGAGYGYQWQVDKGAGFINLTADSVYSNVTSRVINLATPPGAYYGFKYRCIASNGSNNITSNEFLLRFGMTWTGDNSQLWNDPSNWSCGTIPNTFTDVFVNSAVFNQPLINVNTTCHGLKVQAGAKVTIGAGVILTITGR